MVEIDYGSTEANAIGENLYMALVVACFDSSD